jgi:hypothetical protein
VAGALLSSTHCRDATLDVNFGATDHARRVHDATRDEVRSLSEIVSSMHRQIHRLQTDVRSLKGEG